MELRATVVFKQCPQPKKLNGRPHLPPQMWWVQKTAYYLSCRLNKFFVS
jgi:hypothetical protein